MLAGSLYAIAPKNRVIGLRAGKTKNKKQDLITSRSIWTGNSCDSIRVFASGNKGWRLRQRLSAVASQLAAVL